MRILPHLVLFFLGLTLGCQRPELQTGSECSLNSDCGAPLVCALERCRRQCVDSRDCGAGLLCLSVGDMGGACQLPEEARCALTSECTSGLQCRFATCTTACAEDRDCPPGAECQLDAESGANACVEPVTELCIYNSDCPDPLICGPDQRCQLECAFDRDCTNDRHCVANLCEIRLDGG